VPKYVVYFERLIECLASYVVDAENEEKAKLKWSETHNTIAPGQEDWDAVKSCEYLRKIVEMPEGERPTTVVPDPLFLDTW
jgi:hypothetical protein